MLGVCSFLTLFITQYDVPLSVFALRKRSADHELAKTRPGSEEATISKIDLKSLLDCLVLVAAEPGVAAVKLCLAPYAPLRLRLSACLHVHDCVCVCVVSARAHYSHRPLASLVHRARQGRQSSVPHPRRVAVAPKSLTTRKLRHYPVPP